MSEARDQAKTQQTRRRARSGAGRAAVERPAPGEAEAYQAGSDQPLAGYTALLAVYGLATGAIGAALLAKRKRLPERLSAGDVALLSVATFKLSRVATRDAVTSPLRMPFSRYEGDAGSPAEVSERARGRGLRRAVGELVTCPFCLGQWVATGFVGGFVLAPRVTRVIAAGFGVAAASDAIQLAYGAATRAG